MSLVEWHVMRMLVPRGGGGAVVEGDAITGTSPRTYNGDQVMGFLCRARDT
jgi:hypothetical protein